ncbi:MAG: FtsQ-type POTRA domain-containing protein, partial [Candidatus Peregrinibacteria bacterium]|nr:FtsQ-type POTRA domain-containing protein [Candidatus Peregrinibacteria bacterium]
LKMFRASFLFGVMFFAMGAFILFAFSSPYFTLKKISVVRDNPNLDVEQVEKSMQDFYGKNMFFLSQQDLSNHLKELFPEFREVKITESWPDELGIQIEVSEPVANVLNVETANFSVISEDGVILTEKSKENLPTIKILQYEKPILPRNKLLEKEVLNKIFLAKNLFENNVKLPVREIRYLYAAREIHLVSENEMVVWIDTQIKIESQIKKLEFAASQIGLYSNLFDHIDLRIPEQIFWEERAF